MFLYYGIDTVTHLWTSQCYSFFDWYYLSLLMLNSFGQNLIPPLVMKSRWTFIDAWQKCNLNAFTRLFFNCYWHDLRMNVTSPYQTFTKNQNIVLIFVFFFLSGWFTLYWWHISSCIMQYQWNGINSVRSLIRKVI